MGDIGKSSSSRMPSMKTAGANHFGKKTVGRRVVGFVGWGWGGGGGGGGGGGCVLVVIIKNQRSPLGEGSSGKRPFNNTSFEVLRRKPNL